MLYDITTWSHVNVSKLCMDLRMIWCMCLCVCFAAVQQHYRDVREAQRAQHALANSAGFHAAQRIHQRLPRTLRASQNHLQLHVVCGDHDAEGRNLTTGVVLLPPRGRGHGQGVCVCVCVVLMFISCLSILYSPPIS